MKMMIAGALLLGLMQAGANQPQGLPSPSTRGSTSVLDELWIPALGRVRVSTVDGTHFSVSIDSDGVVREQSFVLDAPSTGARVRAAKATSWLGTGLLIALAVEDGEKTSYHHLRSGELPMRSEVLPVSTLGGFEHGWCFSKAIFTSTGTPYRIVDAHCHSGDGIEITFRRGWPNLNARESTVDEKIFFDTCPMGAEALGPGRADLFDVGSIRSAR